MELENEKDINQRVWESILYLVQDTAFLCQYLPFVFITIKGLKPIYILIWIGIWVGTFYLLEFIAMDRERQRKRFEKIEKRLEELELKNRFEDIEKEIEEE